MWGALGLLFHPKAPQVSAAASSIPPLDARRSRAVAPQPARSFRHNPATAQLKPAPQLRGGPLCCRLHERNAGMARAGSDPARRIGAKAADRTGRTVALAAYGIPGRLAAPAWAALIAVEAALAAGIAAGIEAAAYAAGLVLAGFLVVQVAALAAGRRGRAVRMLRRRRAAVARVRRADRAAGRAPARRCRCSGRGPDLPLVLTARGRRRGRRARRRAPERTARRARDRRARARRSAGRARSPAGSTAPRRPARAVHQPGLRALQARGARRGRARRRASCGASTRSTDAEAWAAARVPGAPFAVALGPAASCSPRGR